jgi:hypothetical protein
VVEDRQRERRGFSGTGLSDADDVASAQHERDGLDLDGSRRVVSLFGQRPRDRLGEAEALKRVQVAIIRQATSGRRARSVPTCRGLLETSRLAWAVDEVGSGRAETDLSMGFVTGGPPANVDVLPVRVGVFKAETRRRISCA